MIRVGILGAGNMGQLHARLVAQGGAAQVVAVADAREKEGNALADLYGASAYTNVDQMLDEAGLDMVFICLPNALHAPMTLKALEHGCHVFCEKPMATRLSDARAMADAAQKANKRLFIGFNRRFVPVYVQAKADVDRPEFKAIHVNIIQNDGDMGVSDWLTDIAQTGGFLFDTTVHFFDMAEFLLDEIESVWALSKQAFYPIEDDFVIQFRCKSGRFGVISSCGHASWITPFERVQVVGDHCSVITEELEAVRSGDTSGIDRVQNFRMLPYEEKWGYTQMHAHMFDALQAGAPSLNDFIYGLRSIAVIEAVERSCKAGGERQSVTL